MDKTALDDFQRQGQAALVAAHPAPGEVRIPEDGDPIPDVAVTFGELTIELEGGGYNTLEGATLSIDKADLPDAPARGILAKVDGQNYTVMAVAGQTGTRWLVKLGRKAQ